MIKSGFLCLMPEKKTEIWLFCTNYGVWTDVHLYKPTIFLVAIAEFLLYIWSVK